MQRSSFFAIQLLSLAASCGAVVVQRREKASAAASSSTMAWQKGQLFSSGQFVKKGKVQELQKDDLFKMAWVPAQKAGDKNERAIVAEENNCADWTGGLLCHIEKSEHALVHRWMPANATVMEFGARFGTTTCEIAKKMDNTGRLVSIEPDNQVWPFLEANVKKHHCHSHILRGAISSKPLNIAGSGYGGRTLPNSSLGHAVPVFSFDEVEKATGLKFDTLLIDCEGCAQDIMDQIGPKIETQVNLVMIEADMGDSGGDCTGHCMNYKKFFGFLEKNGFEKMEEFNNCDRAKYGGNPTDWCGPWIYHSAWRKKQAVARVGNPSK